MKVPFMGESYRGNVPINYYPASDQDREVIMFGTPGLDALVTPAINEEVRALHAMGDYLYALCGAKFYQIDTSWTATLKGTVGNGTGPAWIVDNGVQIAICDNEHIYVYKPSTGVFGIISDPDFPGASCLDYMDGYGVFINPNTQQFWLTALYDFTDIDPTDYASAEGWPDKLLAVKMHYRELWLLGPETIEIWQNTGDSPFPFGRAPGGFIHQGVTAPGTVVHFDNGLAWLNHQKQVMWAQGRQPLKISTAKMDREVGKYTDVTLATAFEYADAGHVFLVMIFPGNAVWVYDAATKNWHKRCSFEGDDLLRWRGNCYIRWNDIHVVGDYANGKIYEMNSDFYDDDGEELPAQLDSNEMVGDGKPIYFPHLQIDFDHGEATGTLDPQAMLAWSDDGGKTFSSEIWTSMGKIGETRTRSIWRRLGMAVDSRIFRLKVTAAVNRNILGVKWI